MFFLTGAQTTIKKNENKISNDKHFIYSKENKLENKKIEKEPKKTLKILNEIKSDTITSSNGFLKNKTDSKKNLSPNKQLKLKSIFPRKESENNFNERLDTRDNYINIIKNISGEKDNSVFEKSFKKSTSQFNFMNMKKKGSLDNLNNLDISNIKSTNKNLYKIQNQSHQSLHNSHIKSPSPSPKKNKIKEEEELADRKFAIFEKIYSFNSEFVKKLRNEKKKKFTNLQDYQTGIIRIVAERASMENLRSLSQQLNNIREISESSAKIGRTNWKLYSKIIGDCKANMKSLRNKIFNESEFTTDNLKFQKDLGLAVKKKVSIGKKFCKYETSLKRISPFIPEYLVEKFKNTLKIIN